MRDGKRAKGWVYRTEGRPPHHLVVQLRKEDQVEQPKKEFTDDQDGAERAGEWITEQLGRDDWRFEECDIIGWRIVLPEKVEVTAKDIDSVVEGLKATGLRVMGFDENGPYVISEGDKADDKTRER